MGTGCVYTTSASARPRRLVSLVGVTLVLALLCLAGCGQRATATATPVPHLAFHPVALPPGFDPRRGSVATSPLDGTAAWACAPSGSGTIKVWATTDEGSTWHAAGTLHPATPHPVNHCGMHADQGDTRAAVFIAQWGSIPTCDLAGISFYTHDDGHHWQQLDGWIDDANSVTTAGAAAYAVVEIITPAVAQHAALVTGVVPPRLSGPGPSCLAVAPPIESRHWAFIESSDGLQTWHEVGTGVLTSYDPPSQFWRAPASGDLVVASYSYMYRRSAAGGANWTQVKTPAVPVTLGRWVASRQAWLFCGERIRRAPPRPLAACSSDAGTTWTDLPELTRTLAFPCDASCHKKGEADTYTFACPAFALATDGAVLASCPLDSKGAVSTQFMAYRLAPGAAGWAVLGRLPARSCRVSDNNIMWCQTATDGQWQIASVPM